ncbi:hypothetical protein KR032_002181, partial [Drosophila birchii]
QILVEAEMEKSRRAVEHKLISLSRTNQAIVPPRPSKRVSTKGTAGGAESGTVTGGGGGGGGVQRRKQNKKQEAAIKPQIFVTDVEPKPEKLRTVESRMRGGYNVLLESPRRNGLTPRDFAAEAELAALMATAQRSGSGGGLNSKLQEKGGAGDADAEFGKLAPLNRYGQLGVLPRYKCSDCGARFHVRSLLGAHRRTHEDDFKVRFCNRCPKGSSTTLTTSNQCKFCDRKFDLVRTLHIHQLTHCKKIPPQLRRKLAYTELAHEKKAPLPSFQKGGGHGHDSHHSQTSHQSRRSYHSRRLQHHRHHRQSKHPSEVVAKTIVRSSMQHERWR